MAGFTALGLERILGIKIKNSRVDSVTPMAIFNLVAGYTHALPHVGSISLRWVTKRRTIGGG
ncbi:hypothetical protein [Nitrosococcus oceani]|uniref:hypothetical protein n=1 Tax=Nitrosococcus oceani TaxID=1229 RepID=UPI0003152F8D|nr:hypothetical protein [Nitrosococcus oceani]